MILNEKFLRNYAQKEMLNSVTESVDGIRYSLYGEKYDIFLSHSSLDQELTCALYDLFTKKGFKVYLDYGDNELNPNIITSETGEQLRSKLKKCKCLAYISTSNISNSKWCPWELGLFDGISGERCRILPIIKDLGETIYNGQEYLGMYPYLSYVKRSGSKGGIFWVNDPNGSNNCITLEQWLSGEKLKNIN